MSPETYLHSDIQDIMVTKPSFVLRRGSLLITALLLVLLAFAAWFKYPEFVLTPVALALPGAATPAGAGPQALYLALGTISAEQYAVVRPGQQVLLRINELGGAALTGRVVEVATLARQHQHRVVIAVVPPAGVQLHPSFSGSARIVLKQRSLLAKFLATKD